MPKIVFRAEEMKPVLMIGTDAAETASQHEVKEVTERPITQEYVVAARILAIKKWQLTAGSSPRFMFIVQVKWTDGHVSYISRDHDDFFRYHSWVLDTFHAEAGHLGESRTIPDFPGKKWFRNDLCLAEERKPLIHAYLNGVVKLKRISESQQAQAFFKRRPGDPEREDPLLQSDDTSTLTESDKEAVSSASEAQGSAHSDGGQADSTEVNDACIKGSHDNKVFAVDEDDLAALQDTSKRVDDENDIGKPADEMEKPVRAANCT